MKKVLNYLLVILAILMAFSCSPGKMVGEGYLVGVSEGKDHQHKRFDTTTKVDSFIYEETELKFSTPSLISNNPDYWDFQNGWYYIYVEKQGLYQRREGGKKRWRVYDEVIKNQSR